MKNLKIFWQTKWNLYYHNIYYITQETMPKKTAPNKIDNLWSNKEPEKETDNKINKTVDNIKTTMLEEIFKDLSSTTIASDQECWNFIEDLEENVAEVPDIVILLNKTILPKYRTKLGKYFSCYINHEGMYFIFDDTLLKDLRNSWLHLQKGHTSAGLSLYNFSTPESSKQFTKVLPFLNI